MQKEDFFNELGTSTGGQPSSSENSKMSSIKDELLLVTDDKYVSFNAEQKPHSCAVCRKTFVTKPNLLVHMRKHIEEPPNSCDLCGKTFPKRCMLLRHLRVHTGEKPFSCSQCEKTFAQKDGLNRHSRMHTGEKPYACELCGDAFRERKALRLHLVNKCKGKSIFL